MRRRITGDVAPAPWARRVSHRAEPALAAVLALAMLLLAAPAGAEALVPPGEEPRAESDAPAVPAVSAVRLTVRMATTSDWSSVRLSPGHVVEQRLVGQRPGATARPLGDGWHLRPAAGEGWAWAEFDVVFAELADAQRFSFDIDKGYDGETRLVVIDASDDSEVVLNEVNNTRNRQDPSNRLTVHRDRDSLFGTTPLELPTADDRKLALAFYYPWFGDRAYQDPDLPDRPLEPRSTYRYEEVLSMTEQARAHGINGFIVSWAGADADGAGFDRALRAAEESDGLATGYLETLRARDEAGDIDVAVLRDWLLQLLARADSPAFLTSEGIPVVFVWQMAQVPAQQWQQVHDSLAAHGHEVRLVGDTGSDDYRDVSWGVHRYLHNGTREQMTRYHQQTSLRFRAPSLLEADTEPHLVAGTVSPGFIKDGETVVARGEDGERYDHAWQAALAGEPDWVTVTSWNEWYEATSIEPSVAFGRRALDQTAQNAAAWRTPEDR